MTKRGDISLLIKRFIEGEDISVSAANRLEVALDEMFPDDAHVQDVVAALAMYRPGGGDFLFGTSEMQRMLIKISPYISHHSRVQDM